MKATTLAAAIALSFSAPVLAQSSVQVYGIADVGIHKTQDMPTKIISGGADGSRLGVKGTEDIGNGYKAIFNLEARVELDTGTQVPTLVSDNPGLYLTRGMQAFPAPVLAAMRSAIQPKGGPAVNPEKALFDRTAMVGLVTPVGAVLFGRMYTPAYEVFAAADAFETGTAGTWGGITTGTAGFTNFGADIRSQRSVQYRFTTPSGIGGSLMYGVKGSGYLGRYNRFVGGALTYKANGWDVGIGHNRGTDQADRRSLSTSIVGGSYLTGNWKLFAGYARQRNPNSVLLAEYLAAFNGQIAPALRASGLSAAQVAGLTNIFTTNITANSQMDANGYQVGLHYRLGPGRIMASAARQDDRTRSNSDVTLLAVGYDYNLSKRTDIYTVFAHIKNQNDGQFTPGTAGAAGGFALVPGENSRAVQLGIRHRF
ncbi:MAG: porin [Gammaproteobacteria bacterium]